MNRVVITDSAQFEEVIADIERILSRIRDIFTNENRNAKEINATSTWTSQTQEVIYNKYKLLEKNFNPIDESLQIYIAFLKKTLQDYKDFEAHIESSAANNSEILDVHS